MHNQIHGACLCGAVTFTVADDFSRFFQCHCKQCQQLTGSAFASNLFTDPDNIEWRSGADEVVVYRHPSRDFSKSFCRHCGSALPFISKSGKALIVPAGSLSEPVSIKPTANIFRAEQAHWLEHGLEAVDFVGFPD